MRPIKFRCWNLIEKKWITKFWIDNEGVCRHPYSFNHIKVLLCNEFFIDQFTGLHDRNGKEIYEGDIIKTERFINNLFVKWDYDQWGLFDGICNELSIDSTYDEIIGSVHENPELLETK